MNRIATYYDCFYNPLKYIDPTGESCYGPSEAEKVQLAMNEARQRCWNQLYRMMEEYDKVYQQIKSQQHPFGIGTEPPRGSRREGNSGDGKPKSASKSFDYRQLTKDPCNESGRGKCVLSSLGSARQCWDSGRWGESTKEWGQRENEFYEKTGMHGYETGTFKEFLEYNPDPSRYNSYVAKTGTGEITPAQIYDLMNGGYVVAVFCTLESGENHFANIESCTMYDDNSVMVEFSNPNQNMMLPLDYISTNGSYTINPNGFSSPRLVAYKLTIWKH